MYTETTSRGGVNGTRRGQAPAVVWLLQGYTAVADSLYLLVLSVEQGKKKPEF